MNLLSNNISDYKNLTDQELRLVIFLTISKGDETNPITQLKSIEERIENVFSYIKNGFKAI